jgi:hypothetical protein
LFEHKKQSKNELSSEKRKIKGALALTSNAGTFHSIDNRVSLEQIKKSQMVFIIISKKGALLVQKLFEIKERQLYFTKTKERPILF